MQVLNAKTALLGFSKSISIPNNYETYKQGMVFPTPIFISVSGKHCSKDYVSLEPVSSREKSQVKIQFIFVNFV